jgi:Tfp pilus assembly protein PilF
MSVVNDLLNNFDFFLFMQNEFNKHQSDLAFGEQMSDHLYPKWEQNWGNILTFISRLDTENRRKIIVHMWTLYIKGVLS